MIGLQVVNCGDLARPIHSDCSQHPPIFENKDAPVLSGYMEASQMRGESRGWRVLPIPPGGSVVKNLPANSGDTGDLGSIPEKGRSPRGGNGNPLLSGEFHGQRRLVGYSP